MPVCCPAPPTAPPTVSPRPPDGPGRCSGPDDCGLSFVQVLAEGPGPAPEQRVSDEQERPPEGDVEEAGEEHREDEEADARAEHPEQLGEQRSAQIRRATCRGR